MRRRKHRSSVPKRKKDEVHERKAWEELDLLARKQDIKGFYARYAKYLEKSNILSPQRKLLYKMAKLVSDS